MSYMNGFYVNNGGLLHMSNNVFSAGHSSTHILFAISNGGQIIHDDLNRCGTTGVFTVATDVDAPPHVLHLKGYTALDRVAISHAPTAAMDGLSIELTAGKAAHVTVSTGLGTNVTVLITDFVSTGISLNGTMLSGSNVTVVGGTVGSYFMCCFRLRHRQALSCCRALAFEGT